MSDDVFKKETPTGDEGDSALDSLVGEGKKFATAEDLAKGKLEADSFIEQLQGETKLSREQILELEGKVGKQATIAELIEAVKESNKQVDTDGKPLSEEDLSKLVRTIVSGDKESETKEANHAKANQAVLDKVNGDVEAARSYVEEKAREHGMTVDELQALGESSPSAFHKLMETKPSTGSPSVVTIPGFKPPADTVTVVDGHKTKAYYDALKKELGGQKYWGDSRIQGEYFKDAMALGDRFNS